MAWARSSSRISSAPSARARHRCVLPRLRSRVTPATDFDVITASSAVRRRRRRYGGRAVEQARIVAANKIDAVDDPDRLRGLTKHLKKLGVPIYPISAVTGEGVPVLLEAMWRAVAEAAAATPA